MLRIGVDLGGTKIEVAALDADRRRLKLGAQARVSYLHLKVEAILATHGAKPMFALDRSE